MSSKNSPRTPNKRRTTIRNLAVGGIVGTSGAWSKPVVESVILPAHAEISDALRDPCFATVLPESETVYFVLVQGQVIGPGNSGIQVNIAGNNGVEQDSTTAITGSDGTYEGELGPFDVCVSTGNVQVTVSSPSFADTATCPAIHQKVCVEAE